MPYVVKSSEKTRHYASTTETKAMLYLMNLCADSDEIFYFVVDFFNDVTGMDRLSQKLWDVQSKSTLSSPKAIGRELVTLFKNYLSDFDFTKYILFLGDVSPSVRSDPSKMHFGIDNVTPAALAKIKAGLQEECVSKGYIDDALVTNEKIDDRKLQLQVGHPVVSQG